jgi:hypothetical protein
VSTDTAATPIQEKAPSRAPRIVVAVAVTLIVTLVLIFINKRHDESTTAKVTSFELVTPTEMSVTFEVDKAYLAQVSCVIQAQDRNYNVVGSTTYVVGPLINHHRASTHNVSFAVTGKPVTAIVDSCVVTRDH